MADKTEALPEVVLTILQNAEKGVAACYARRGAAIAEAARQQKIINFLKRLSEGEYPEPAAASELGNGVIVIRSTDSRVVETLEAMSARIDGLAKQIESIPLTSISSTVLDSSSPEVVASPPAPAAAPIEETPEPIKKPVAAKPAAVKEAPVKPAPAAVAETLADEEDGELIMGIRVPSSGKASVGAIFQDAVDSVLSGQSKTPPAALVYRTKWRRDLWAAKVEWLVSNPAEMKKLTGEEAEASVEAVPAPLPSPADRELETVGDALDEIGSVDPRKKGDDIAAIRASVAVILRDRFPEGSKMSAIRSALAEEYQIDEQTVMWMWVIMTEGDFAYDDKTGIWSNH